MRRKRNESTVLHEIRVAPWRRGAPKAQDRCASKRHPFYAETSMTTVQSAAPYRHRKRSRRIFALLVCEVTSGLRNESTVLHMIRVAPWRRGAPKAQDGSPKRYERQWSREGLVASDLGLECCFRASPPSLLTREQSIDSQSKSDTPLGRTLNPEPSSLLENAPCKTPLTQPHQTDTITHA